jgi:hypothetical protein
MASIFELVVAQELTAYWNNLTQDRAPYLGQELFPAQKKLGLNLKWIKGAQGLPVVLNPSAFDTSALKRSRIGFGKLSAQMPFFKESMYVDEELRQELNLVLETNNKAYINSVMSRVFNDEISMLEGAAAQRERMRMMALTTGVISISANGQDLDFDYGIEERQKKTVTKSWSDPTASIIDDIRTWQDETEDVTGVRPTRAVCSRKTWGYFTKNTEIRNGILGNNSASPVSDKKVNQYLLDELELQVVVYTKRYMNESGQATKYVADDTFVLFPTGNLGNGWFGTTPEESDLNSGSAANVSITDTGVAVTTVRKTDPVNVDTKVTMIYLPSFEQADKIIIADVNLA